MKAIALFALGLALVAVAVGCGGSKRTYTTTEAVAAFEGQGFLLDEVKVSAFSTASREGKLYRPRHNVPMIVIVAKDSIVARDWRGYVKVGPDADSFDARRGNVIEISDSGLTADQKRRVLSALRALPDRGAAVETISK